MPVLDTLAKQASRLATDVQLSLKRARLEGERRLLQRQHRQTLEELGERVYELVRAGKLPEGGLGPELSAVESKLMEIQAKLSEIESLRLDDEGAPGGGDGGPDAAFPMVDRASDAGGGGGVSGGGPGPGWEAAERFFKRGS
ncbi:MAG: hypothetical protein QOK40_3575 [Miltoncostaeaceae bacterium]|jgi:hypothetical protein|nr:hypothetical protein [Miltoncostaeaceae bacterium]